MGGKHGSIWQNCVFHPSFERFFDPFILLNPLNMLPGAEDDLATFSFPGCPELK